MTMTTAETEKALHGRIFSRVANAVWNAIVCRVYELRSRKGTGKNFNADELEEINIIMYLIWASFRERLTPFQSVRSDATVFRFRPSS